MISPMILTTLQSDVYRKQRNINQPCTLTSPIYDCHYRLGKLWRKVILHQSYVKQQFSTNRCIFFVISEALIKSCLKESLRRKAKEWGGWRLSEQEAQDKNIPQRTLNYNRKTGPTLFAKINLYCGILISRL